MQVRFCQVSASVSAVAVVVALLSFDSASCKEDVTSEDVELAIKGGVSFLKRIQLPLGNWVESDASSIAGTTCLVALALLTAGEKPDSPAMARALAYVSRVQARIVRRTYTIALQTMVFARVDPNLYRDRIIDNVRWLEEAQIRPTDAVPWPGTWTYDDLKLKAGDNSNTQYALLGLHAAHEVGIAIEPIVWARSRAYFERAQTRDGGWGYPVEHPKATGSMTCGGLSSMVITGVLPYKGHEHLEGKVIRDCGEGSFNIHMALGIDWLRGHFSVRQNFGHGRIYHFYYLYGLERAARLSGVRYFGVNDWYRQGAEELVRSQQRAGFWQGEGAEQAQVATSFALLFLSKGRSPVLINKLAHLPVTDWNNDPDDVRMLTDETGKDWKQLLTWQIINPHFATALDMQQAPIAFLNGHEAPEFDEAGVKVMRAYLDHGGFLLADACCGDKRFDEGFRKLIKKMLPEEEYALKLLTSEHPVYRSRYIVDPRRYPLWGVEQGCRTIVIYSEKDLSCYWNQRERDARNTAVTQALLMGRNIVDYATGRERLPDKLAVRSAAALPAEAPERGAFRVAKLKYSGEWNVAPRAIPNLMETLRRPPLNFDVTINQKNVSPRDADLIYYPLVYMHGRSAIAIQPQDMEPLRRHLNPGGGTLFADAACGTEVFDRSFRQFVKQLLPGKELAPIPRTDPLYSNKVAFDLADCELTAAAGGRRDYPQLEGVQIDDHWAIIYSRYDIGCALEQHSGNDCKGYTHSSATRIAANIVIYSTLP